jgi:hypothetical protein
MFTSSFEAMYSAFSRMHVQRTWDAISTLTCRVLRFPEPNEAGRL